MTNKQVFELLKGVLLKRFPEKVLYINDGAKSAYLDGSKIFTYELCPYILIVKENKNIFYAEHLYYDKINNKISPSKEKNSHFCPKCGKEIKKDSKYCMHCGEKLE